MMCPGNHNSPSIFILARNREKTLVSKRKIYGIILFSLSFTARLFPETVIGSAKEEYYYALALMGISEEPSLNFRILSSSRWNGSEYGPWEVIDRSISSDDRFGVSIIDPQQFISWNSAYPHGGNDGALWQGVGLNAKISGGAKFEFAGFSATFAPEFSYSANEDFSIMPTAYADSYGFGYFRAAGMDVYQRPGDDPIMHFNWGESEVRYTWKTLTAGFGTQQAWIGPGKNNAIILSNNAEPFPKFDLGLEKTSTRIGQVEFRSLVGFLNESHYFDSDDSNNTTTFSLISASWTPVWTPGFTVGFNRSILSKGTDDLTNEFVKLFSGMGIPFGHDEADQRASATVRYVIPEAGFEIHAEWAKNDYTAKLNSLLRYPFHAQGYTLGVQKALTLLSPWEGMLVIGAELSSTESSRDYEFLGPYSFYGHHIITQGYTNIGQIIGAALGTGGNGQYFDADYYAPWGKVGVSLKRINRDNDYVYFLHFGDTAAVKRADEYKFNTELSFSIDGMVRKGNLSVGCEATFSRNLNPLYNPDEDNSSIIDNVCLAAFATWSIQ